GRGSWYRRPAQRRESQVRSMRLRITVWQGSCSSFTPSNVNWRSSRVVGGSAPWRSILVEHAAPIEASKPHAMPHQGLRARESADSPLVRGKSAKAIEKKGLALEFHRKHDRWLCALDPVDPAARIEVAVDLLRASALDEYFVVVDPRQRIDRPHPGPQLQLPHHALARLGVDVDQHVRADALAGEFLAHADGVC